MQTGDPAPDGSVPLPLCHPSFPATPAGDSGQGGVMLGHQRGHDSQIVSRIVFNHTFAVLAWRMILVRCWRTRPANIMHAFIVTAPQLRQMTVSPAISIAPITGKRSVLRQVRILPAGFRPEFKTAGAHAIAVCRKCGIHQRRVSSALVKLRRVDAGMRNLRAASRFRAGLPPA